MKIKFNVNVHEQISVKNFEEQKAMVMMYKYTLSFTFSINSL